MRGLRTGAPAGDVKTSFALGLVQYLQVTDPLGGWSGLGSPMRRARARGR